MTLIAPGIERLDLTLLQNAYDPHYQLDIPNRDGEFAGPIGVFIGAGDPEADGIEREAWGLGIPVIHARGKNGARVSPAVGDTYDAVLDPRLANFGTIITIETAARGLGSLGVRVLEVDHHGERGPADLYKYRKDPYGRSSFGQFHRILGIEPDYCQEILGGLDDCALDVFSGKKEGLDPHDARIVMEHEMVRGARKEIRPSVQSRQEVHDKVDSFGRELDRATPVQKGGVWVCDFTDRDLGVGYSEDGLALKTAGALFGHVAVAIEPDSREGNPKKLVFTGAVTKKHVKAFLRLVDEDGLENPFVDLRRGIAKAYLPGELARVALMENAA